MKSIGIDFQPYIDIDLMQISASQPMFGLEMHLKAMFRLIDIFEPVIVIIDPTSIEVIDFLENPQLAKGDQILAVPTLVRKLPPPIKKSIGDLSNTERVLVGLDLRLYVAGMDPKSVQAIDNIKRVCEEYLPGRYQLEVIDIYQYPIFA